jgi:DeoR/GlpR family transcriptional regulator of sugar metabolism
VEVARALAARSLREQLRLRVATHAVNVASELASAPAITVYLVGGELSSQTLGTFGPDAIRDIGKLHIDLFFLAVTGIDVEHGFTNSSAVGLEIKRTLVERARRTLVVADASKWGRASLLTICPLDAVDGWIYDRNLSRTAMREAARAKLELLPAP